MLAPWKEYDHKNRKQYCLTLYRQITRYCNNPKSKFYFLVGGQGTQCHFTSALEFEYLYKRDQADQMEEPVLIRKKDKKPFSKDNCTFIEGEKYRELLHRKYFEIMAAKEEKRLKTV